MSRCRQRLCLTVVFLIIFFAAYPQRLYAKDVKEYYNLGVYYMEHNDYEKAIDAFENAIRLKPNVAPLYVALGLSYLRGTNDPEKAANTLRRAVDLDPHYAEAYFDLGTIYAVEGRDSNLAIAYFQKAIESDPNYASAYLSLGWLYLTDQHDDEQAITNFNKTIQLSPENADGYYGLGVAYVSNGERAKALKPITKLRALGRDDLATVIESRIQSSDNLDLAPAEIVPILNEDTAES